MPTSTVQDYLKAILTLSDGQSAASRGIVSLGKVSERVGVSPGTVTSMMRQLADSRLVDYEPRRGVKLTKAGRAEAVRVVRRHRLVELFLVQVMQMDWAHVHEEAEALEHAISDRMLDRMDQMLGHPASDPHGDPIPTSAGETTGLVSTPLSEFSSGVYRVVRVIGDEPSFLSWLEEQGFRPGRELRVESRDDFAQTITVTSIETEKRQAIGASAASRLLVTAVPGAV
jgi:DtxR family Mn-dependent transcriptional regulator